jgi:type VI secretion system protein VasI
MIRAHGKEVLVRRFVALFIAFLALSPTAVATAARQPAAELCVTVIGAPDDVTAQELTEGIGDGTYTIASVHPCSEEPRPDPRGPKGPGPDPTPAVPTSSTGQWVVNPIETDPLTDESVAGTWVFADGSATVALIVQCLGRGQTKVSIFWTEFLDLTAARITTRIDDEEPATQGWPVDELGTTSYYPTDELAFLGSLFGKSRLVAQTTPWNENPMTVVFPITGIENAVANVRQACGW